MPAARELGHQRAVVLVRRAVEAQAARREGGDRPAALGLQQRLRERVEGRRHEVAVQAVERQQQRLARLRLERRPRPRSSRRSRSPTPPPRRGRRSSGSSGPSSSASRIAGPRLGPELAELQHRAPRARRKLCAMSLGVGLEVAGQVGVVGHERSRAREALARVLPGQQLLDEPLRLLDGRGRQPPDRQVRAARPRRSPRRAAGRRRSRGSSSSSTAPAAATAATCP